MSDFIKTRNHLQCRSHHRKMLSRFGSISKIIEWMLKNSPHKQPANSLKEETKIKKNGK